MSAGQIQWFSARLNDQLATIRRQLASIKDDILNAPQEGVDELDRAALEDEIGKARALEVRYTTKSDRSSVHWKS